MYFFIGLIKLQSIWLIGNRELQFFSAVGIAKINEGAMVWLDRMAAIPVKRPRCFSRRRQASGCRKVKETGDFTGASRQTSRRSWVLKRPVPDSSWSCSAARATQVLDCRSPWSTAVTHDLLFLKRSNMTSAKGLSQIHRRLEYFVPNLWAESVVHWHSLF
jgi:hypothetical protein